MVQRTTDVRQLPLTQRHRLTLAAAYYEHPAPTLLELAHRFGISRDGIRKRLQRARKRIQASTGHHIPNRAQRNHQARRQAQQSGPRPRIVSLNAAGYDHHTHEYHSTPARYASPIRSPLDILQER